MKKYLLIVIFLMSAMLLISCSSFTFDKNPNTQTTSSDLSAVTTSASISSVTTSISMNNSGYGIPEPIRTVYSFEELEELVRQRNDNYEFATEKEQQEYAELVQVLDKVAQSGYITIKNFQADERLPVERIRIYGEDSEYDMEIKVSVDFESRVSSFSYFIKYLPDETKGMKVWESLDMMSIAKPQLRYDGSFESASLGSVLIVRKSCEIYTAVHTVRDDTLKNSYMSVQQTQLLPGGETEGYIWIKKGNAAIRIDLSYDVAFVRDLISKIEFETAFVSDN